MKRFIVRGAALCAALLLLLPLSADHTIGWTVWRLYQGSTIIQDGFTSLQACAQAADNLNVLRSYHCATNRVPVNVTADTVTPPPTPVDCVVSAWTQGALEPATCPVSGTQTRTDTRTILTQPANGGAACPSLTQTVSVPCTYVPPPPPPANSYPLYPALDLAAIPWHNGTGAWGARVALQAPAQPVTTRQVSVNSVAAFNSAAAVAGTQITVTAGWAGNTVVTINANDVDVILPAGVAVGAIEVGAWPRTTPISRLRIRGDGRMGQYRDFPLVSDVTIDGVDMNGSSPFGGAETNQVFRIHSTRVLVKDVRAISAGYIWLGDAKHVVIANSNFYHGAANRSAAGFVEGWGIRQSGGPLTIVDSRIQGTRYHNLRAQSVGGQGELLYATRSVFVGAHEGRTAWMWNNLNQSASNGQGAVLDRNDIYTYTASGCAFSADLSAANVQYSRVSNNRFFGAGNATWSQGVLDGQAKLATGTHEWAVGNTFAPLTALPAWGGPGDPTQVPLPSGLTLNTAGESPCFGF